MLRPLSFYLKNMHSSCKKQVLTNIKFIITNLCLNFDSDKIPDLEKTFALLGKAAYREVLIRETNEMINYQYGGISSIWVEELKALQENCLEVISLLNKTVQSILYHQNVERDESLPETAWDDPEYIKDLERRVQEDRIQVLYENGIEN